MSDATSLLLIALTAGLNAGALVAIKRGLSGCGPLPVSPPSALIRYVGRFLGRPDGLLGTLAFLVAPVAFTASLRSTELLVAYPTFMGLSFALTTLLAVTWLGEVVRLRSAAGTLLILAGIVLLHVAGG